LKKTTKKGSIKAAGGDKPEHDTGVVLQTVEHVPDATEKKAQREADAALKKTQKTADGSSVKAKPATGKLAPNFLKKIKGKR